ncbi:MAG: RidA family protein [Proteobacteria bacterium]|nr:RidA family protein [Pseudomonadota bacterium]
MHTQEINSAEAPQAAGGYSQALEVKDAQRTLYISGQIPVSNEGHVPETFEEQAAMVWNNIKAQLKAADMEMSNLVKVTIFLSDRKYTMPNRAARAAALGEHKAALTVIIAGIFDEAWLLEIEAIAAA